MMVHILKLEGDKDRYMELYLRMLLKKSRFSLLKADYIILNLYVHRDLHENDYGICILNLCDHITSMITLKQL